MSNCCSVTPGNAAAGSVQTITTITSASVPSAASCPNCRDAGRIVERRTMLQMLKPDLFGRLENLENREFYFCQDPSCSVVYYTTDGEVKFSADDLRVKVGVKMEGEPSAQICYCFGYTEAMITDELRATGQTTIPKKITELTKTGMCACEVRNPAGVCCLGNVNKAVKRLSEQWGETMIKKLIFPAMLAALSISLGACGKSDTDQSSAGAVNNQVAANKNAGDMNKQPGGQVTIISGADKGMVKIRSTGFRWPTCLKRVVDALKDKPGIKEVIPNIEAQPLTVTVRFDGQKTNAKNIGEIAKQATETDPKITGPVTLSFEEEK